MTTARIQKQLTEHLALLSPKQQLLVLEMIKNMVPEQINAERLTIESYNQELDEAVARIEAGVFVSHEEALQQLNL
ncbi:MAG: hypothetical protein Q8J69_07525 [Sphingobacteriaceae bacterium]|nr:hypothetical protein [Sphingobacteriaceae bacterium]